MSKVLANPNEIFGFPVENITKTAEENIAKHYCKCLSKAKQWNYGTRIFIG
ncbi:MAG: hypothetical protein GX121_09510 [Ignavibacteria bacterium]|nr:hypothetical protein [Ignavibacteria bacterium]